MRARLSSPRSRSRTLSALTGGSGVSAYANVPTTWDAATGENILWRAPLAGLGHSSPIVWGNRLFVSTAIANEPLERVCRAVWPLFFSMVGILALITLVPPLAMWLPGVVYGR